MSAARNTSSYDIAGPSIARHGWSHSLKLTSQFAHAMPLHELSRVKQDSDICIMLYICILGGAWRVGMTELVS